MDQYQGCQGLYSMFDSKANQFLPPFLDDTDEAAQRQVAKAAINVEHNFHIFPGDYTLFKLGYWDMAIGALYPLEAMLNLGTALQINHAFRSESEAQHEAEYVAAAGAN